MEKKAVYVIQGPNLNLLGKREPNYYGLNSLQEIHEMIQQHFPGYEIEFYQSNIEGELITKVQEAGAFAKALIINPGGYSHTSVALTDALRACPILKVEVHMSNIHNRDEYRQHTLTGSAVSGVISGLGADGYVLAMQWIDKKIGD